MASLTFVVPGQTLSTESGFLKGHGTYVQDISTSSSSNSGNSPPLPEGSDNLLIEAAPESDQLAPDDKSLVPTKETSEGTAPDGPTPPAKRQRLVASCAGVIQRVNRLISVIPLRQAYNGEVGDLVVGQVTEVSNKRWKLRIGATRDSSLNLSSVNLPVSAPKYTDGEQTNCTTCVFWRSWLALAPVALKWRIRSHRRPPSSCVYGANPI